MIVVLRPAMAAALLLFALAAPMCLEAATTITVSDTVMISSVKRFGINLGLMSFFDSGQILKNLASRNPGFEGLITRSIAGCASGTATSFVDDFPNDQWPTGFWNGGSYEVIDGAARGRSGTIATSTAPSAGNGTLFVLADSGTPLAAGDLIIVRKSEDTGATAGWVPNMSGGGTITGENSDLSSTTPGRQAVRLTATGAGQTASISSVFDTSVAGPFVRLSGTFRLSFKARGAGGSNQLRINLSRGAPANTVFHNQTLTIPPSWTNYDIDFTATESGSSPGNVELRFTAVNPSALLLDDVTLQQTNGDATNATAFRDPVVNALRTLNPGLLRYWVEDLGDSLDNEVAPQLARMREQFRPNRITREDIMYGLHEFLELCELVRAEPWYIVPTTFSTQEISNLLEYLGGPASAPYGARRAARGRSAPWTAAFSRIHLEFGNEAWNLDYRGAALIDPAAYGRRGSEMFDAARRSPYYSAAQYNLVLGGQAAFPARNVGIHAASRSNDALAFAPYIGGNINTFGTNEDLFGPLFAETEMVTQTGYMRENYTNVRNSSRPIPLAVYEVNLHTTTGSISQAALDSFAPSAGAGLAVADHMLMMLRDLGIKDQMLYSLTGYAFGRSDGKSVLLWSSVRDMGVSDRKRPQYLALQLINEVMAGDLVQTTHSGDNPTWNQPLVNGIQYNNAHYIRSYALAGGASRAVIVFNVHRTDSLQINFSGANAPRGAVAMRRLSAPAITSTNESSESVLITRETISNFDPAQAITLPPFSMTVFASNQGRRRAVRR